jgi:hypothetical protein
MSETAILCKVFIFHHLIRRCLFQLELQHPTYFLPDMHKKGLEREREREREEYMISIKLLRREQRAFKNVNNCLNTNIYSYLDTSGGQSSNPYLNAFQHQS